MGCTQYLAEPFYTSLLESANIKRGRSNASVFYRERDGTIHGDDFLVLSDSQGLQEIHDLLRECIRAETARHLRVRGR